MLVLERWVVGSRKWWTARETALPLGRADYGGGLAGQAIDARRHFQT